MAISFEPNQFQLPAANVFSGIKSNLTEKFYYTILVPKSFRPNSDFTFNLTIHNANCEFNEPVVVRVSIQDEKTNNEFVIQRDITMNSNATEVVTIPIGDVPLENNYKLTVNGISGVKLQHEASLDVQTQMHIILIQTDKGIYKPNDCIKYRVLVLDSKLKAAAINSGELSIQISVSVRVLFFWFSHFFIHT